jgi:hypothetical protein
MSLAAAIREILPIQARSLKPLSPETIKAKTIKAERWGFNMSEPRNLIAPQQVRCGRLTPRRAVPMRGDELETNL